MNIQAEKLNLLRAILSTNDITLISNLKALLNSRTNEAKDWFETLSNEQQADIKTAILEAENNQTFPHSEAIKRFGKWDMK